MRKFQQLFLVIISVISIIFLIIYRSENSRLKYVLEVVNFFGQTNDAVNLVHLENDTNNTPTYDFIQPTATWQRIGSHFVYSAFWHKYPSIVGGEVITIAVGLEHAIVRFNCDVMHTNGTKQRGKFGFSREEITGIPPDNNIENYIIYRFRCKLQRDYGQPQSIIFTEINTNIKHRILIRNLHGNGITHKLEIGMCLNLIQDDNVNDINYSISDSYLLQFIYHHHLIGIDEIFVYDNGAINNNVKAQLAKHKIPIQIFQFNFPFQIGHPLKIQRIIEIDCLLRTMNLIKYVSIAKPNEFLYPDTNVQAINSFLKNCHQYSNDVLRFDIILDTLCINVNEKLLARSLLHKIINNNNNNINDEHNLMITTKLNEYISIYRPSLMLIDSDRNVKNVKIDKLHVSSHRYENCDNNKTEIYDWRATIGMRYLEYYDNIDMRVKALLDNSF